MLLTKLSLSNSLEKNIEILKKIVEDNNYNIIIRNGRILFKNIDNLNIRINSSDKVLRGETTIFIFRKSKDDLLIDTELILYPQYVSMDKDKLINNKKINNILTSFETYVNLMSELRSNNNKKVGEKYLDIVKTHFNKDRQLNDLTNYCASEGQCTRSLCCKGSNKYYFLFTRCFDSLSDLFYTYALKRSSKEKHHRVSSNWSNKIINYDVPHLSKNDYTDKYGNKVSWSELNLDIEASHNTSNQGLRINSGVKKQCDLYTFKFKNRTEIEKKVKHIIEVVKNTKTIRYLTLGLSFLVHSNRILIDIKNKRIIRIEPHGFGRNTFYDVKQLDCLIQNLFKDLKDFDYINEEITNHSIPSEYLSLFNNYNVQGSLPLCQLYSSYVQLLSIHYPKYTIITLNEIVSKHDISRRIQNFFKLFFEFLDKNIDLHTLLSNENVKLKYINNESKPIYTWMFTKNPEVLNSTECQTLLKKLNNKLDIFNNQNVTKFNDKVKKINDESKKLEEKSKKLSYKIKIFNQNVNKFNAMKTAREQQNFRKVFDESKNDYEKSKADYEKSKADYEKSKADFKKSKNDLEKNKNELKERNKAEMLKCKIDYKFGLPYKHVEILRKELYRIHNLSEKFVREKNKLNNKNSKKKLGKLNNTRRNLRKKNNKKHNSKKQPTYANKVKKNVAFDGWCKYTSDTKKPYYYSRKRNVTTWKKPFEGKDIPTDWCIYNTGEKLGNITFYQNVKTGKSQKTRPVEEDNNEIFSF